MIIGAHGEAHEEIPDMDKGVEREECWKCGEMATWTIAENWGSLPDGKRVLWCSNCWDIVGGLWDVNPFLDEVEI